MYLFSQKARSVVVSELQEDNDEFQLDESLAGGVYEEQWFNQAARHWPLSLPASVKL